MLLVRAKQPCAICTVLPSQGTLNDGRAACIGCALVGALSPGRALVAYNETTKLANNVVLSLLRSDGEGTLVGGRKILHNRLGTSEGAYNIFATELVRLVKERAQGKHGLASDMGRRIDAKGFAEATFLLFRNWLGAESIYDGDAYVDGREEQVKAAATALYEPLATRIGKFGARSLIEDALGPFGTMRDSTLGRLVPRIGEEEQGSEDMSDLYELFDPDSDLISSEVVQFVDASLLRRARDKLQSMTKGKRYNTARLENELLKIFAANLRRGAAADANAEIYAAGIAEELARQTIVANSKQRGTMEWANFVAVAGTTFYESNVALPPAVCRQSQTDFVKAHPGDGSYPIIADELVNMAAFFNKRAFDAAAIPSDGVADIPAPSGVVKIPKTAEYRQVVQDLQRVRASMVGKLNSVCSEVGSVVKQDKPLDGKAIVDNFLLTLFDQVWASTVPHAAPDATTFAYRYTTTGAGQTKGKGKSAVKKFFTGPK